MNLPLAVTTSSLMLLLLGGAALILYVSGRLATSMIPARLDRPGTRAILAAIPVGVISLISVAMGRPLLGLHLPIACAAAAMTFGLAAVLASRTPPDGSIANRSWTLMIPAVAMLLIAALGGKLDVAVLVSLVGYGLLAINSWSRDVDVLDAEEGAIAPEPQSAGLAVLLWCVGIAAAVVAGVLAIYGTEQLDSVRSRASDSLAVVFLLAPAIVIPFFFELLPPCRSIGWSGSISTVLKFSLICVCFILPAAAAFKTVNLEPAWQMYAADVGLSTTSAPTMSVTTTRSVTPTPTSQPADLSLPGVPSIAARADLLVLVGVALLLIPMGAGWVRPGKPEAIVLLACYVMNLLLVMAGSV